MILKQYKMRKLISLHAKCRFLHKIAIIYGIKVNRQSFDEWQSRWSIIFQTGPVSRQTVSRVSEVGDWTECEPLIGHLSASDWSEMEPELSRAWAVITKQENWQIQWEFHREWVGETGVKKRRHNARIASAATEFWIFCQVLISL